MRRADALPPFWDDLAAQGTLGIHRARGVRRAGRRSGRAGRGGRGARARGRGRARGRRPSVVGAVLAERGAAWPRSSSPASSTARRPPRSSSPDRRRPTGAAVAPAGLVGTAPDRRRAGRRRRRSGRCVNGAVVALVLAPVAGGGLDPCGCCSRPGRRRDRRSRCRASTRPGRRRRGRSTGVVVPPARILTTVTTEPVRDLALLVSSAEAVGGARWCLDIAAEHARTRHQFGRPIGQFQGVKHRLADMLVSVEQGVAATWDAATSSPTSRTSDERGRPATPGTGPSVGAAGRRSGPRRLRGRGQRRHPGPRWDGLHLGARRPHPPAPGHDACASWSAARRRCGPRRPGSHWPATRRRLSVELPPEADDAPRRAEPGGGGAIAAMEDPAEQRRALAERGTARPALARSVGPGRRPGRAAGDRPGLRRGGAPPTQPRGRRLGPSDDHGPRHPRTDRAVGRTRPSVARSLWCQLFSEPGAGSDLAALDHPGHPGARGVVARPARRSGPRSPPAPTWGSAWPAPIPTCPSTAASPTSWSTCALPGIEVRPLREITGARAVQRGLLRRLLRARRLRGRRGRRRVAAGPHHAGQRAGLALVGLGVRRRARGGARPGGCPSRAPGPGHPRPPRRARWPRRSRSRSWACGPRCVRWAGSQPGSESSVRKLLGAEFDQRVHEFGLDLLGPDGVRSATGRRPSSAHGVLQSKCLTIAGGTSEVQRNVIGERLLGLAAGSGAGPVSEPVARASRVGAQWVDRWPSIDDGGRTDG